VNTEIIFIADESGSMSVIKHDANGAFDQFVSEQRAIEGECRMSLTTFANEPQVRYEARDIKEVPPLDLHPSGNTALFDAIGVTMNRQGERIAREKWADLVILAVITDGQENASREYSLPVIRTMIEHAESNGWKVMYLASGQDAFKAAANIGSKSMLAASVGLGGAGQRAAYSYASEQTTSLRTGKTP